MSFTAALKNRFAMRFAVAIPLMGVMFTYFGAKESISASKPRLDFNELSISDIDNGAFYEGEIHTCIGNYATEESDSSATTYYYLVSMGDIENEQFITLATSKQEYVKMLDRMSENTYNAEMSTPFIWKGRANKIDNEVQDILNEVLVVDTELYSSTAEVSQHVAPYVLYYHTGEGSGVMLVIGIICLAITAVGAFIVIRNRRGSMNTVPPIPQNFYNSNTPSDVMNINRTQDNTFASHPAQSSGVGTYTASQPVNNGTASVSSMSMNGGMDVISTQPQTSSSPVEKKDESLGLGIMDDIDTSHLSSDE